MSTTLQSDASKIWFVFPAYVDSNLVGTGKIARAAILGLQGGVWAASPGFSVHWRLCIPAISLNLLEPLRSLRKNRPPLWKHSLTLKIFKRVESASRVISTSHFSWPIAQCKGRKWSVVFLEFLPVLLTDSCDRSLAWWRSDCEDHPSRSCRCICRSISSGRSRSYRWKSRGLSHWTELLGEMCF